MKWNERFTIGDGKRVPMELAPPVWRSYQEDCGITLTKEEWREQRKKWTIYFPSNLVSDITFKPKAQPEQTSSQYHFLSLDVKFPRPT